MPEFTAQQVTWAAVLVIGIATTCQVVAPRLRIPALVLLLPAGFLLGALAPDTRLDSILGAAFPVAVDLMVAVILFQGGMKLSTISLAGPDRTVVRRLLWLGAPITGVLSAGAAHVLLGFPWPIAVMLGAIVIVSGPTVVTPILDLVRPDQRVRGVLLWEGTLLDPIGALVAVVVFQLIKASAAASLAEAITLFLTGTLVAALAACVGVTLCVIGGRLTRGAPVVGTQVLLGSVIVAAGLADVVADDSGLLAALLMGFTVPRIASRLNSNLEPAQPFFDTVVAVGIGILFVSIAALVSASSLPPLILPTLAVVALLVLIVRPLVVLIATRRSGFSPRELVFMSWMYPRGIVAAATASSVGTALIALRIPDADQLLPVAFLIIAATVTIYGLTALPLAKALGIRQPDESGSHPVT